MLALTVVVLWFGLVTVYLVRQWWSSELAQAREGVPAPAPVTLTAAEAALPTAWGRELAGPAWAHGAASRPAGDGGQSSATTWGRVAAANLIRSGAYVAGAAAR